MRIKGSCLKLSILGMILCGCVPQHQVHWVNPKMPTEKPGVYYALPRTVVTVSIPVTKITIRKGTYADEAAKLGIHIPSFEKNSESFSKYSLGSPSIETRAEPDPENVFLVELRGNWHEDRDLLVELTENGLLTSAESKATDKTVDYFVKTIGAVAKTYAAASGVAVPQTLQPLASAEWPRDPKEQARLIAYKIREVRNKRIDLVSASGIGQAPIDEDTLDRMLQELDAIEEDLMSNFRRKSVSSWTAHYEYAPNCSCGPCCSEPVTLFYFDDKNGLTAPGAGGIEDIPAEFKKQRTKEDIPVVVSAVKRPTIQFADQARTPCCHWRTKGKHGFFYRIPATGRVTVKKKDSDTLAVKDTLIAQFGTVKALPPGVKSTNSNFLVNLHEETGALKKVQVSSKALDPALIDELGAATAQIASVQAAQRAAEAAEPSKMDEARAMMENCAKMLLIAKATGQPLPDTAAQCLGGGAGEEDGAQ